MELRHLHYFLAVAEELNFRKAAEKLFISQPGLSRQIKDLEDELEVQLLERSKKHVHLTAAGDYFQSEMRFLLNHLESAKLQLKQISEGRAGELRVGFLGSASNQVLPEFMRRLDRKYPGISTTLEEMTNAAQVDLLLSDKLDLGFVRLASVPEGLEMKTVSRDTFSLVVPRGHSVTEGNFHSLRQVENEDFLLFSSDYSKYYYDQIMSICRSAGFHPKIKHKSVHALTIFKLVEQGMGVSIVPHSLQDGYDLGVRFMPIPDTGQFTELSVLWKPKNRNPVLQTALPLLV
ncbi:LysR family transcriptional regulator [Algoriphagus namhaensis]